MAAQAGDEDCKNSCSGSAARSLSRHTLSEACAPSCSCSNQSPAGHVGPTFVSDAFCWPSPPTVPREDRDAGLEYSGHTIDKSWALPLLVLHASTLCYCCCCSILLIMGACR
ncbi:hypothetical protein ACSS6W_006527 [Trichoderma asperelloides]